MKNIVVAVCLFTVFTTAAMWGLNEDVDTFREIVGWFCASFMAWFLLFLYAKI